MFFIRRGVLQKSCKRTKPLQNPIYKNPIHKGTDLLSASKYIIFHKVVEQGSFTRAAEALGCTQSAVSHAINALESETGLRLILRSRAGISLTPDGERLLPAVKALVEAAVVVDDTVAAIHGLETGRVRIGAFTSVAVHWLPRIIKAYQPLHPHIEFGLMSGDYHDIALWLSDSSIDIGFVTLPMRAEESACCSCTPLMEDRLLAVLPKNHPLASLESIPVNAIAKEPFISLLENSDHDARKVLARAGVRPNIKYTTKDDYAIIAMVEQGLGVSIMPELLLQGRTEGVRVLPIEGGMKRTIGLAVADAAKNSPAVQNVAEYIRTWVQTLAAEA